MKRFLKPIPAHFRNIIKDGVAIALVGVVGTFFLLISHAATPTVSVQAESGTVSAGAGVVNDVTAANKQAVKFGSGNNNCTISQLYVPSCGALWGEENNGSSYTGLVSAESQLNATLPTDKARKFDVFRRFYANFDTPFLGTNEQQGMSSGHIIFISWNTGGTTYPAIASGSQDSIIDKAAEQVKALGNTKIFIDFQHEPDHFAVHSQSDPNNSGANYASAYKHVHDRFSADGVTNVVWAWVMGGEGDAAHRDYDKTAYPGDNYVDWIGYDSYSSESPYVEQTSAYNTLISYYKWLQDGGLAGAPNATGGSDANSKPWLIGEFGENNSFANAPTWFQNVPTDLAKLPQIKMLIWFNLSTVAVTSGEGAQDPPLAVTKAFAQAGSAPFFNQR